MTSKSEKFNYDLVVGQEGEDRVFNLLRHKSNTKMIMDVSKDKSFQHEDVDLLVQTTDDVVYRVEVKRDRQADKTGNIVFETKSNSNEGCLQRSKADFVFWVTDSHIYWHTIDGMKQYIEMTRPKEVKMGDNAKGYILGIRDLILFGALYEI